jgi:D-alanyl-D-alanine carboxypeptidase (penicillin-binding protein 5/6)
LRDARAFAKVRAMIPRALVAVFALALAAGSARASETVAREAILVDFTTGQILFEKDADKRVPPASMSKIMTAYLVY